MKFRLQTPWGRNPLPVSFCKAPCTLMAQDLSSNSVSEYTSDHLEKLKLQLIDIPWELCLPSWRSWQRILFTMTFTDAKFRYEAWIWTSELHGKVKQKGRLQDGTWEKIFTACELLCSEAIPFCNWTHCHNINTCQLKFKSFGNGERKIFLSGNIKHQGEYSHSNICTA